MTCSRRDMTLLFAAATGALAQDAVLPSKTYKFEDLKVRENGQEQIPRGAEGQNTHRADDRDTPDRVGAGVGPHAPHHHAHEEMIFIREGTLEVTISGKSEKLGPGSVAYVASNEEHGWRNVGTTTAHYFVLAIDPR